MIVVVIISLVILGTIYEAWQLNSITLTRVLLSQELARPIKAVVLADLHGKQFGRDNIRLIDKVKEEKPNLMFIPGDLITACNEHDYHIAYELLAELVKICPVYYSYGNHERASLTRNTRNKEGYKNYIRQVKALGVYVLDNSEESYNIDQYHKLSIVGLNLPLKFYNRGSHEDVSANYIKNTLHGTKRKSYTILMAHSPNYIPAYLPYGAELTLCGHNHGGLVRFPKIGSLIAPDLSLFPRYDGGTYQFDNQVVNVSRGLGTHTINIRVHNRPEIVVLQWQTKN